MERKAQFSQGAVHSRIFGGSANVTIFELFVECMRHAGGPFAFVSSEPVRYKLWQTDERGVPLTLPVEGALEVVDRRDPDVQASVPAHTEQKSQPDRIYEWLSRSKPATVREIANALGIPYHSAKKVILLMQRAGRVQVADKKKKSTRGRGRAPRLWTAARTSEVTRG